MSRDIVMQHISTTPFGRRAMDRGLLASQTLATAPAPVQSADKWQLFDDLRLARRSFGLTDRDLTVLNALLSFLPGRDLDDGTDLIVFPSNATLCDRAHGMAESTLRRHLSALVTTGMIARHDSPNGKRYVTRGPGGAMLRAFGFSLRPFLVRASAIAEVAEAARAEGLRLKLLRESVVLRLRDVTKLSAYAAQEGHGAATTIEAQLDPLRKALRRQLSEEDLIVLERNLGILYGTVEKLLGTGSVPAETSASDAQNERHYQNSEPDFHESEPAKESRKTVPALPLALVVKACPDLEIYARTQIRSWPELIMAASYVRTMMGITLDTWEEAKRIMGPEAAAITVAAMLQKMATIRNPGGYLRHLATKAAAGGYSPGPLVMALLCPANERPA